MTDPADTFYLCNLVDRLGLDINESGYMIAWFMECYEKGYLTTDDFDGIEMNWGDSEAVASILRKIAHREGCGDLFAEGTKRSAERVGGEAQNCCVYTMKEPLPAVTTTGATGRNSSIPAFPIPAPSKPAVICSPRPT